MAKLQRQSSRPGVRILGLLTGLVLASPLHARTFIEVGTTQGLDARVVASLLVDHQGFLWVGSREGLFRYDGYEARAYLPDPGDDASISDIDIRALTETRDGELWIATNTGGLNRFDRSRQTFEHFRHDSTDATTLSDDSVYAVAEGPDGRIWAATQEGLNRFDATTRRFERFRHARRDPSSLAHDWVYTLHRGGGDRLWVGTVGGGLDLWRSQQAGFTHFDLAALTSGPPGRNDVFAIHESRDGRVWAGTREGLVVVTPTQGTATEVPLGAPDAPATLVTSMFADGAGRLWLGTMLRGVLIVDIETGRWMSAHPGSIGAPGNLPAQPQLSLAGTGETLFVGTWGDGVYRAPLQDSPFRLMTRTDSGTGLRNKNVTSVLATRAAGRPWVGSFGGGIERVDIEAEVVETASFGAGGTINDAGVISLASTDTAVFAGVTTGLYRLTEHDGVQAFYTHDDARPNGMAAGYVNALLAATQSELWIGTGGFGLQRLDLAQDAFVTHRHAADDPASLSGDYITSLLADEGDVLWVGTRSNGLNRCHVEAWHCERYGGRGASGLSHYHVTSLHRDALGRIWVGTDGGGLNRVDTSADGDVVGFAAFGRDEGLLHEGIMAIEEDDLGSLWLSTRHGLSRFEPESGAVTNYVTESGLPVSHFNANASSADDRFVYFGSVEGLVSVPRALPLLTRTPSPLRITGIERFASEGGTRQQILDPDSTRLRYGDVLSVQFAVLDYAEVPHEYEYRMSSSEAWSSLGNRRELTFFGLAPGAYSLEVRGRDVYGLVSSVSTLSFGVIPPFWMTHWFRALIAACLILLLFTLHRVRTHSLRRRNAELRAVQIQREQALEQAQRSQAELQSAYDGVRHLASRLESAEEAERRRISHELHDELGQQLTATKLNLQMLEREAAPAAGAGRIRDAVGMVDAMIRQVRDISLSLRPPLLDEAGLVAALDHHLRRLAERSGTRIEFAAADDLPETSAEGSRVAFRVVQEAVNNALRHAAADRISVALDRIDADLKVTVHDDGRGFDLAGLRERVKRGDHLGVLGMTERVRSAGGRLDVESTPGVGTRVIARIPA